MLTAPTTRSGGCECGAVRYQVSGPMRKVVYCHCGQCRRTSGHYVAATACDTEALNFLHDAGLQWYRSSDVAERGFCKVCGASLFWRPEHGKYIAIMAGTLDVPTGLSSREHIHTADASDYYSIDDELPKFEGDHDDLWETDV